MTIRHAFAAACIRHKYFCMVFVRFVYFRQDGHLSSRISMVICAPEFLHADLHEFLTAAYQFYDIIIWSATR